MSKHRYTKPIEEWTAHDWSEFYAGFHETPTKEQRMPKQPMTTKILLSYYRWRRNRKAKKTLALNDKNKYGNPATPTQGEA